MLASNLYLKCTNSLPIFLMIRMLLPNVLLLVPDVETLQSDLKKEQEQLQDTKKALGAVHLLLYVRKLMAC